MHGDKFYYFCWQQLCNTIYKSILYKIHEAQVLHALTVAYLPAGVYQIATVLIFPEENKMFCC